MYCRFGSTVGTPGIHDYIETGGDGGHLRISFRQTVRVSDNKFTSDMPPDLGTFPIFPISEYGGLPSSMRKKQGAFISMHRDEAMTISFEATAPFAVKIYVGGINALSGCPDYGRWTYKILEQGAEQDYIIIPPQKYLDGFVTSQGKVRQFVAMKKGSDYTLEQQLKNNGVVSGLRFQIIPNMKVAPRIIDSVPWKVDIKFLSGKILRLENVHREMTVHDLKRMILEKEHIPLDQQSLIFDGKQMVSGTLGDNNVRKGCTIHIVLRLSGGELRPQREMRLAPGGEIRQKIAKDQYPTEEWDIDNFTVFDVQILNSLHLREVAGIKRPPLPIDEAEYLSWRLPYFKDTTNTNTQQSDTGDHTKLKAVKSIREIDNALEPSYAIKSVEMDPEEPSRGFSPYKLLQAQHGALMQDHQSLPKVEDVGQVFIRDFNGNPRDTESIIGKLIEGDSWRGSSTSWGENSDEGGKGNRDVEGGARFDNGTAEDESRASLNEQAILQGRPPPALNENARKVANLSGNRRASKCSVM